MKEKISMIVFVLILGGVLTAALVAVDHYTEPRITKNKASKRKIRVLSALDISLGIPHTVDNVEDKFPENVEEREVEEKEIGKKIFYVSKAGDIAFEITGKGLWGNITCVMAVAAPDYETLKGIAIIHQEETPGLGARIAEKAFLDTFRGKKLLPQLTILPASKKAEGDNEVDGITGATFTGKAFEEILNSEAKKYLPLLRRINDDT